jgi:hypothetical protein
VFISKTRPCSRYDTRRQAEQLFTVIGRYAYCEMLRTATKSVSWYQVTIIQHTGATQYYKTFTRAAKDTTVGRIRRAVHGLRNPALDESQSSRIGGGWNWLRSCEMAGFDICGDGPRTLKVARICTLFCLFSLVLELGQIRLASSFCEHGSEHSSSVKGREFLD